MVRFQHSLKQITTISALILILLVQLGSSGLLINKHFCKGELTEVSVLLANKGCNDDMSFADRLTHKIHDCKKGMAENGIQKSPCCDFESIFSKIFVYQDAVPLFHLIDALAVQSTGTNNPVAYANNSVWPQTNYRPPPDSRKNICIELCRYLI